MTEVYLASAFACLGLILAPAEVCHGFRFICPRFASLSCGMGKIKLKSIRSDNFFVTGARFVGGRMVQECPAGCDDVWLLYFVPFDCFSLPFYFCVSRVLCLWFNKFPPLNSDRLFCSGKHRGKKSPLKIKSAQNNFVCVAYKVSQAQFSFIPLIQLQ